MNCNGYVKIKYHGRYGNKLFIYFMARLYAEKHNLNLLGNIDNTFFEITSPKHFGEYSGNELKTYTLNDSNIKDNELPYYGKGVYVFDGYFQNEDIFSNKRHLIISIDYYIYCIKKYANNYKNIYIICDKLKHGWEKIYMHELIKQIKLLNKIPIYTENSIENDIINILQSNYIVTSNSTLCFWAVFFSNAEKIILFPYVGIDILPNRIIKKWRNNPKIFKYNNDEKFITTFEYSNNVIDYFQKM